MAENKKSSSYDSQTEKITNPARIAAILKNILDARTLLRVTLPESSGEYNSAILEIDNHNQNIVLDELNPREGHERLLNTKKIAIFTHVRGVDVSFASLLKQSSVTDNIASYLIGFPKILHYRQLRANFRIPIGITQIPVGLVLQKDMGMGGELHDISAGGICIRFNSDIPDIIKVGSIIDTCTIDLPDNNKVESKLEVRFRGKKDDKGRILLGCRFINMERDQQRAIERYVASLDREMRRKMPRD